MTASFGRETVDMSKGKVAKEVPIFLIYDTTSNSYKSPRHLPTNYLNGSLRVIGVIR